MFFSFFSSHRSDVLSTRSFLKKKRNESESKPALQQSPPAELRFRISINHRLNQRTEGGREKRRMDEMENVRTGLNGKWQRQKDRQKEKGIINEAL